MGLKNSKYSVPHSKRNFCIFLNEFILRLIAESQWYSYFIKENLSNSYKFA